MAEPLGTYISLGIATVVACFGLACTSDADEDRSVFDAGVASGAAAGVGGANGQGGAGGLATSGGRGGSSTTNCDCALGAYAPACGVDGVTYDATCGVECVPVDIACMGECPCSPAPGQYMGVCAGDGGLQCDGDLICVQYFEFSGGSGSGGRYCTRPCSEGCPAPSPGCGENGRCDHI